LNRRIKRRWLPPTGMEEVVLIQFRVSAQGKLMAVTPVNSDGAPAAAAVTAVRQAFPFKALPSSFSSPYLDIRYTFNYRINELNDIPIQPDRLPAN
jgi:outer membrane biosynthesis protein TonB